MATATMNLKDRDEARPLDLGAWRELLRWVFRYRAETALLLVGGLAVLTAGAEALVRGASRLAPLAGISPPVVGLTVVAY